jgi:hypothetical protein
MLVKGGFFDGSNRYLEGSRRMRSIVGNASPFTTLLPIRFPHIEILYLFLSSFFDRGICCHLVSTFVAFLARVLESYGSVTVYVALRDHHLLNFIFQRVQFPIPSFTVDAYDLYLTFVDDMYDIVMYNIRFLDMNITCVFYGIVSLMCGSDSKIDFIHFVWQIFERFNFRKYAVALIPSDNNSRATHNALPQRLDSKERGVAGIWKLFQICHRLSGLRAAIFQLPCHSCSLLL